VARARALLTGVLDGVGVEGEPRSEALLVVSELVTNAIRHGSRGGDVIGVDFTICGGRLCICVQDAARGDAVVPLARTADEQRPAGRGLNIVERFAQWSERVVDGKREVRAEMRL
jgi:anti-sigma regulatory factor (Ser/Thr protein kinase)